MSTAYLGLGSNLDAERHLKLALRELSKRFAVTALSPIYRSRALGFDGEDFLNGVVCIETALPPRALCDELEQVHELAGRRRHAGKLVSRTLDIDLLLYDRLVTEADGIDLPRPDVLQYSFVLKPLADIAPDYVHPVSGKSIADHWRGFDAASHPLTKVDLTL